MWPQTQNSEAGVRDYAAELEGRRQAELDRYRAGIKEAILQSWPAELAKSAYGAATLPGDVYAGKVNPMSDEAVGRSAELAGLMTMGAGAMPAGRNEMRMGIKAYHGSPHDFDRFDMSKIGTGEGAQAYGHGLYFAGNEGVAKGYRDTLSRGIDGSGVTVRIDGNPIKEPTVDQIRAARFGIESTASGIQKQIDATRQKLNSASKIDELGMGFSDRDLVQMQIDEYTKRLNDVMGLSGRVEMGPAGRMYEVNLNTTPDRLLDWDKPLREQSQPIQDALKGVIGPQQRGGNAVAAAGVIGPQYGPDAARKALLDRGIDGIKYLDAGSRFNPSNLPNNPIANEARKFLEISGGDAQAALKSFNESNPVTRFATTERDEVRKVIEAAGKEVSRNYVMFDDKLISILRKYGVATAAALPAAALAELGLSRKEAERTF